jgi:MoxR-like ATPase
MSEEMHEERNVAEELNNLGKQFVSVIRTAWESEDRKRIQDEIMEGLQKFGDEITNTLQKASESETGKEVTAKAEKVITDVKASDVADDVRKGLLSGLDALNVELGKLSEKLDAMAQKRAEAQAQPPVEPKGEA